MEQRQLLQSIRSQGRINAGSPLEDLRFYELSYEQDGVGRNILTALTECRSASRTICYQPTRFGWLKSESKIDSQETVQNGLLPKSTLSGLLLADVSGDGRPDLLYTELNKRNYFLYVKEATANAGFSEWTSNYKLPKKADGSPPQVLAIDINSDGIQDVIYSKYEKNVQGLYMGCTDLKWQRFFRRTTAESRSSLFPDRTRSWNRASRSWISTVMV